jgi:hypothetical protein
MAKLEPNNGGELCAECLLIDKNRKRTAAKVIVLAGKQKIPLCKDHLEELCTGCTDQAADALLGDSPT